MAGLIEPQARPFACKRAAGGVCVCVCLQVVGPPGHIMCGDVTLILHTRELLEEEMEAKYVQPCL